MHFKAIDSQDNEYNSQNRTKVTDAWGKNY